jgi:hypothetical protein
LINFVRQLAELNVSMSQAILNAGFLDMLLSTYVYDFDLFLSSGADKRACKSALLIACNTTLDVLGKQARVGY